MAATEYPANLVTNSFILHDFAEIAYIVCTGATPASNNASNDTKASDSPSRILSRLRKAEHQFRQASILVALDTEKLELFTFYKKVDVVKDQRAILGKFGYVCRLNSCIIAYKNASRIIELLKPDSARVYRLFTDAIMSSIQISPLSGPPVTLTKSRLVMLRSNDLSTEANNYAFVGSNQWLIHKLDVQIVPTGHVVLTIRRWFPESLQLLSSIHDSDRHKLDDLICDQILCLWPFGQLARFKRVVATSSDRSLSTKDKTTYEYWIQKIRSWLVEEHHNLAQQQHFYMVEAEIPVRVNADQDQATAEDTQWVSCFWPTELTYVLPSNPEKDTKEDEFDVSIDPLASAEEWFLYKGPALNGASSKADNMDIIDDALDDGQLFDDDVSFASPLQFVQPTAHPFATQNTVYPTPPEALTQPTPGMSVDGLANTPFTPLPVPPSSQGNQQHLSPSATLPQSFDHTATRKDSGLTHLTDEDLLSGVTDQSNNHNKTDEPNWEFFDGPDFDADFDDDVGKQEDVDMEDVAITAIDAGCGDGPPKIEMLTAGAEESKPLTQLGENSVPANDADGENSELQDLQMREAAQVLNQNHVAPSSSPKPLTDDTVAHKADSEDTVVPISTQPVNNQGGQSPPKRPNPLRDGRYSIGGKYYFRPDVRRGKGNAADISTKVLSTPQRHNASDSSEESVDDTSDASDPDSTFDTDRPWMHYEAPKRPLDVDTNTTTNDGTIESEVNAIFDVISSADGDDLLQLRNEKTKSNGPSTARTMAIAQVLVEQLANSSLFQDWAPASLPDQESSLPFSVLFDSGGPKTESPCVTLSELTAVQMPNSHLKLPRISKADGSMLSVNRSNEELLANASILQFWDILNLQPLSATKNVRAICLHPKGSNYAHGAEAFLSRIGESYTACNFGKHQPLDLPGMHHSGLMSWAEDQDAAQSLQRVCENVGTSLTSEDTGGDCIVVYIVIPDNDNKKCFQICSAFFELFESFKRGRRAMTGDVALQLIPTSFIASSKTLVILPQRRFLDLAAEVYERLPSNKEPPVAGGTFPHALVARSSNPVFEFELSTMATSPLSKAEEACHLAYAISSDGCWLSATWSDELGKVASSMSYWIKDSEGGANRSRLDILRHVCEVTGQLMSSRRSKWWLCLARVGFYETEELQEWLYLSSQLCDNNKACSRVVLLSIELQPRLTLSSPKTTKATVSNPPPVQPLPNAHSTPVSTPQPTATTSPEQVVPVTPTSATLPGPSAQTPPEMGSDSILDNDLTLYDPLHDIWLVTLPFGLNQSLNFLEVRPALASSFLVKRTSAGDSIQAANATVLGVNLIATPKQPPSLLSMADRESLLRDVLTQFRNMCTLSIIRRSPEAHNHCVPWHIATAHKGANILEALM